MNDVMGYFFVWLFLSERFIYCGFSRIFQLHTFRLAPEFKYKMKYVPFCQSISSEDFRPTDSDLQFGLNDS